MKMIIAIVQDQDSQELADQLVKNNFRATKLATTGGFLRAGNTTFLCGVNDDRVDEILSVINQTCGNREQLVSPITPMGAVRIRTFHIQLKLKLAVLLYLLCQLMHSINFNSIIQSSIRDT
ncbi:protein from nitrogen regulatory protein P-II (GLNB) family [Staphylococcus aureus]|nr:protein from nitrogen regulatory protein P-II (GLNB) family [Staphylococcus aureus]